MDPSELRRASDAATSIVTSFGLPVDEVVVLQNSNKVSLRLLPCDVFARVAPASHDHGTFEVDLAGRLAEVGAPVAELELRVPQRAFEHDGLEVTLWTHYEHSDLALSSSEYAQALQRLHAGLRDIELPAQHFTDRVAEAQHIVSAPDHSPGLDAADRELLATTLQRLRRVIDEQGAPEQLLHGEPHPGNVLDTADGARFIDLETCCRGPVEFDLAHVPRVVSDRYPDVDPSLLQDCRELVLAMVAAWRWEPGDQLPMGQAFGRALLDALRDGPPWPTIDEISARVDST